MFNEVTVLNQNNTDAIDGASGLKCKRRCVSFQANGDLTKLYVEYKQWLVGTDNSKVSETTKYYHIYDAPAVLDENLVEITPAKTAFNEWKTKVISQAMVGATLEQLFVDGAINGRLKYLPINVDRAYDNT